MYRILCAILTLSSTLVLLISLGVSANAQTATATLTQASKLIEQGQPVQSIELIDRALKNGNLPSNLAAKAMLLRAQAQETLGKQAFALADYNSALWMHDLPDYDRAKAEQGRQRIMAKLGVAPKAQQTAKVKPVTASSSWGTEVRTTASEERTGGKGSIFSGVFGSSSKEPAEKQATRVKLASVPATVAAASQRSERQVSPVQTTNRVTGNGSEERSGSVLAQNDLSGDFAIQFSAVHSEDTALYEADRIDKRYSEWLGGRTPSIKIRGTSDGGTLYKIIAAPYERGEGVATCELLKTKGVSCMLISR